MAETSTTSAECELELEPFVATLQASKTKSLLEWDGATLRNAMDWAISIENIVSLFPRGYPLPPLLERLTNARRDLLTSILENPSLPQCKPELLRMLCQCTPPDLVEFRRKMMAQRVKRQATTDLLRDIDRCVGGARWGTPMIPLLSKPQFKRQAYCR